jgi:hypothetical protein
MEQVAEGEVREDLPDDRGIVQRGNQAQAASTLGTRRHVDAERSDKWVPHNRQLLPLSFGLSDQLRGVRVFVVVRIQEQPVSCLTASAGRGEGRDSHPKGEKT